MQPADNYDTHPIPRVQGTKVFGEPLVASVLEDLKQLHDRMVMEPKDADEMTTS